MQKKTEDELASPPDHEVVWKMWVRGDVTRTVEVVARLFFEGRAKASMLLGSDAQSIDGVILEGVEPPAPKKKAVKRKRHR